MPQSKENSVAEAFELFRDASRSWDAALAQGTPVPTPVVSHAFRCAELVLRAYLKPANWPGTHDGRSGYAGSPEHHIPLQLVYLIANQIRYITSGKCPEPIAQLTGRGAPGIGPLEAQDIGVAVAYIRAVKQGLIRNRAPVKTIARLYGVTDGAVRKWQRKMPWVQPIDFHPFQPFEPHALEQQMRKSAERYRMAGRGAKARFDRHKS